MPDPRLVPAAASPTAPGAAFAAVVVLAAIAALCWWPPLPVGFVFDDFLLIDNPLVRGGDAWAALTTPGVTMANRPIAAALLALQHGLAGGDAAVFRRTSVWLHVANVVLLFFAVRAALRAPNLAGGAPRSGAGVAFAVAGLWAVHPLAADTVAYAAQQSMLLGALFLLLALRALQRRAVADPTRRWRWQLAIVLAAALGMASKEEFAAVPLLLLLYERAFHAASWRELRRNVVLWPLLAGTWLVLAWCIARGPRNTSAGAEVVPGIGPEQWLATQAGVVLHYLRLALWPVGQAGYRDWPIAAGLGAALLPGAAVVALLLLTLWLWRRRPWWGWCAALFFLLLAPTSTLLPLPAEVVAERRVYLPMLAALVPTVCGAAALLRRRVPRWQFVLGGVALAAAMAALTLQARARLPVYGDNPAYWEEAFLRLDPQSRSHAAGLILGSRGYCLWQLGRHEASYDCLDRAVQCLAPTTDIRSFHAQSLLSRNRLGEAVTLLRALVVADPSPAIEGALGVALVATIVAEGRAADDPRLEEATAALRRCTAARPRDVLGWRALGRALRLAGDRAGAEPVLRTVIALDPLQPVFVFELADLLVEQDRGSELPALFATVLRARPQDLELRLELAQRLRAVGLRDPAVALLREIVQIDATFAPARQLLEEIGAGR